MTDLVHVKVQVLPDGWVSRPEAAKFLGMKPATLKSWARDERGPVTRHIGGRVYYRLEDLRAYRDTGVREAVQ